MNLRETRMLAFANEVSVSAAFLVYVSVAIWLKVHTALVHACNGVICTWLDVTEKMCRLQADRHRTMQAGIMRAMLQRPSRGCGC